MKKILALLCLASLMYSSITSAQENQIVIDPTSKSHITITKHWKLTPWHDYAFFIENPTRTEMNFEIEVSPTTKDQSGKVVTSAPIKLTCGGKEFYITELSTQGITVCKTNKDFPDIRFELIHFPSGDPSEGDFTLEVK